jgi:prepilin-type N-terminal cleavage/methylation domain-containing protein
MHDSATIPYTTYMRKGGFTIIELLVVIAVIAILAALGFTMAFQLRARTKLSRVSEELVQISSALTQYAEDNNYQYPVDTSRAVPPGLERYLARGTWPESVWPDGVYDWDNWISNGQQIYQITYRLCDIGDPVAKCADPVLFPRFVHGSGIYYCISGPCVPHRDFPTVPGYCVNCKPKEVNPPL